MRRTGLLLASMALVVLLVGGVAWAATFTCTATPCDGTTSADIITGTDLAETINAKGGADQVSARGANDVLNGGIGNDTMDGGDGNDSYRFANSFGADSIPADSSGVDTVNFSGITTAPSPSSGAYDGMVFDLKGPDDPACEPSATHCLSLGGNFIENLVGTGFSDSLTGNTLSNKISGRDGRDDLYGGDGNDNLIGDNGADWLYGEASNDRLNAGSDLHADYYVFGANWGSDTITDGGGGADEVRGNTPSLADPPMGNLKVNLVSSATSAEFTDGTNRVDWSGSVIDRAVTGPGNDEISQRPNAADYMFARGGSDIYKGYDPSAGAGSDLINDSVGGSAVDKLDLASFNLSNVSWSTQADTAGNIRELVISFSSGGQVRLFTYFNSSSTNVCASGPGIGLIETISFADDPSVDFAQVKSLLGCP